MRLRIIITIALGLTFGSCKNENSQESKKNIDETPVRNVVKFKNKGHELVYYMVQKVGDYGLLSKKKDVVYTYTYKTPNGATDVSTEKYLFDGELSYGAYKKHERTLNNYVGLIEQGYDGEAYWMKHQGEIIEDKMALKKVAFNRPTNFYWFAMMQKLLDPGLIYSYLGEKKIDGEDYDIVKVTFESQNNTPKDIYQLYINKETLLVDQFLFTVVDFNKMDPLLMRVKYENIEGILIPTKREYKASDWQAEVNDKPWVEVTWSDIKFNNNLKRSDFKK